MRKAKSGKKVSVGIILLLTIFFVSFSSAAYVIINANKLVFVDNYEQYEAIMENMASGDNKDAKIVDLEEEVNRYKKLYESTVEENRALITTNNELNSRLNKVSQPVSSPSQSVNTTTSSAVTSSTDENEEPRESTVTIEENQAEESGSTQDAASYEESKTSESNTKTEDTKSTESGE